MTYFYDPTGAPQDMNEQDVETDLSHDIVGSALIWSDYPVAAVVDATKYSSPDTVDKPGSRQATSYSATQNLYEAQAIPFVSKGTIAPGFPNDGGGAISGINIMNPNPEAATVNVHWVNQSGFNAANFGVSGVSIPGYANGFVYTLAQHNIPLGFYGAAQVFSNVPVAAVSANVNYGVAGDGAAIINGYNPCGFFRTTQGDPVSADDLGRTNPVCGFGDVFAGPVGTAVVEVEEFNSDDPLSGIWIKVVRTTPSVNEFERDGHTGLDGTVTFRNLPTGSYDIIFLGPAGEYAQEVGQVVGDFVVTENGTVTELVLLTYLN